MLEFWSFARLPGLELLLKGISGIIMPLLKVKYLQQEVRGRIAAKLAAFVSTRISLGGTHGTASPGHFSSIVTSFSQSSSSNISATLFPALKNSSSVIFPSQLRSHSLKHLFTRSLISSSSRVLPWRRYWDLVILEQQRAFRFFEFPARANFRLPPFF